METHQMRDADMRTGFVFSMAILLVTAFIIGSLIWAGYLREQQDINTRAGLARICIEQKGLWNDQSKNCVFGSEVKLGPIQEAK